MDNLNSLKALLGDDADEKINTVLNLIQGNTSSTSTTNNNQSATQIKNLIENLNLGPGDNRYNLLLSLRPYMRESRQQTLDMAIKIINFGKLASLFNNSMKFN